MTCETCKFWNRNKGRTGDMGYDPEADTKGPYHKCKVIDQMGEADPEAYDFGQLPAFTEDGSGYRADLFTLPTFSCSMWKEKT